MTSAPESSANVQLPTRLPVTPTTASLRAAAAALAPPPLLAAEPAATRMDGRTVPGCTPTDTWQCWGSVCVSGEDRCWANPLVCWLVIAVSGQGAHGECFAAHVNARLAGCHERVSWRGTQRQQLEHPVDVAQNRLKGVDGLLLGGSIKQCPHRRRHAIPAARRGGACSRAVRGAR